MSTPRPWGARPTVGPRRTPHTCTTATHHVCSLPTPTEADVADIIDLASTPEGAAALADGLVLLVQRGHASGLLALYLHGMGRAEASWVAAWTEALTAPD